MHPVIERIAPQLLVDDLNAAVQYYCDRLGFALDFVYESFYASVSRDGFPIHLKCAPQHAEERVNRRENEHLDAFVGVRGVRSLYEEFQASGARIIRPLEIQPWGQRDFYVEDPEGHILCFSEPVE